MTINNKIKIGLTIVGLVATLNGCNTPETGQILYIPKACTKVKCITRDMHTGWNLTCETAQGKDIFYNDVQEYGKWKEYPVERK